MNIKQRIADLKNQIEELEEYLHSESCRECYETVLKLDKSKLQLQELFNNLLTDDS